MNVDNLTAKDLLKIKTPEKLFSGKDINVIKKEFRKLSFVWHPDKHVAENNPVFEEVFKHIKLLYEDAKRKYGVSKPKEDYFVFDTLAGKTFKLKFQKLNAFELGTVYFANEFVLYEVDKSNRDLVDNAVRNINSFVFRDKKMEVEMNKYIPAKAEVFETEKSIIVLFKKPKDVFSLRDVFSYFGGKVDAKHVAWILSSLYNTACFFEVNKLTHNNLSLDTCFISPSNHYAMILGGWWYSSPCKERLVALPSDSVGVAPVDMLSNKQANFGLDLELIKYIGRTLLGDSIGSRLSDDKEIPKALISWLRMSPLSNSAIKEYEVWQKKVLKESFGERHFIKMGINSSDIYK